MKNTDNYAERLLLLYEMQFFALTRSTLNISTISCGIDVFLMDEMNKRAPKINYSY